jgi:hypothetical protein
MTNHHLVKRGALAVLLAIMICVVAVHGQGETKDIGRANLTIVGVTLGSSTTNDVERILGASVDTLSSQNELSQFCYASSGTSETVLQFVVWDKPVGFSFFRARHGRSPRCTRTTLVSDKLETGGGVKLGMDRRQVISMFGHPTEIRGHRYVYDFSHERPLTQEEGKRFKTATPPVTVVGVTEKIEFEFTDSIVDLVDVTYSETF